jgi:hypothetical protein
MAQTEVKGMTPKKDPLAWDIATVLQSLGGSAHQTVVIDCVTALQRQRGLEVRRQDLATRIVEVFEHYRDMFFRPFGEGSMRWALAPDFVAA